MTQGEGHRNPLSLSCLGLLTPQSLPTSSSTAVPGVWVPGDPAAGAPAHQTPEKEAVAVPSLSEAVPLTTAFSVLTGKAIEQNGLMGQIFGVCEIYFEINEDFNFYRLLKFKIHQLRGKKEFTVL